MTDLMAYAMDDPAVRDEMRRLESMFSAHHAAKARREARTPVVRAIPFDAGKPLSTLDSAPDSPPVATPPGRAESSTFSPEAA